MLSTFLYLIAPWESLALRQQISPSASADVIRTYRGSQSTANGCAVDDSVHAAIIHPETHAQNCRNLKTSNGLSTPILEKSSSSILAVVSLYRIKE